MSVLSGDKNPPCEDYSSLIKQIRFINYWKIVYFYQAQTSFFLLQTSSKPNQYYFQTIVILNSIAISETMHKELLKRTYRIQHPEHHPDHNTTSPQEDRKLTQIIKTFRENHLKLIQKIQECDKKRDFQHELTKKKHSEKYLLDRHDNFHPKAFQGAPLPRPFSQLKTDRNREPAIKQNRKESINYDAKRSSAIKFEECEEAQISPLQQQPFKLIKIKTSKLVPLSMDKLRERLKLL